MKSALKIFVVCLLLLFVFSSQFAFAQGIVPSCSRTVGPDGKLVNPCTLPLLVTTLIRIVNFFVGISWLIATFFIFWGAYGMATSYGNQEKLAHDKSTFGTAVVGFFMVLIAFLLVNFVVVAFSGGTLSFNPTADNSVFKFFPFP